MSGPRERRGGGASSIFPRPAARGRARLQRGMHPQRRFGWLGGHGGYRADHERHSKTQKL
eukprot:scaffold23302_cov44-Phaeocystis_antarctica.AAC.3